MDIGIAVHRYSPWEGTGGYVVRLVEELHHRFAVTVYAVDFDIAPPRGVETVRVRVPGRPSYSTVLTFPFVARRMLGSHDAMHAQGWTLPAADIVTTHIVMSGWLGAAKPAGALGRGERVFGNYVRRAEKKLVRNCKIAIAPSKMAADSLRMDYGRNDGVHVVPHGFPPVRKRQRRPREPLICLYVGDARKGLLPAIDALGEDRSLRLRVVSHSEPRTYMRRASLLGVSDRIDWIGPSREMDTHFDASDVLVHPTIYDTFGLVVAEAMAAGLPVVTSSMAGIAELMSHGISGMITDNISGGAVARSLDELRSLGIEQIGEAGQQVAAENSWKTSAAKTADLYQLLR